jgi:hydroxypyruvate reductase
MTPVGDTALENLHTTATEIFTGAIKACNIASAFDRRLRFEGTTLHRLLPDGSGPADINLANYKRIFVIAIGKAAGPMLETLLDRMKRRKGLRGICCTNQLPKERNWRIRYFEGGHPLPNEDTFDAAHAALAMLRKARKDTLIFFLISGGGSAMFDLPLDPKITLAETRTFHNLLLASGAPINEVNTLRKHFSAVKGGRLAMAAPDAAKVSLLLPDVPLRTLDALSSGPTSPDHSTVADVRELLAKYDLAAKLPASIRTFFEREDMPESPGNKKWRPQFLSKRPWTGAAPVRNITAAATMNGEHEAFQDSVFELLLSSHDLVENARAQAQEKGFYVTVDNSCDDWDYADAARYLLKLFHSLRAKHERLCLGQRARSAKIPGRAPCRAQRRLGRHRRQHAERRSHCRPHHRGTRPRLRIRSRASTGGVQRLSAFHGSGRRRCDRPHRAEPARSSSSDCGKRLAARLSQVTFGARPQQNRGPSRALPRRKIFRDAYTHASKCNTIALHFFHLN